MAETTKETTKVEETETLKALKEGFEKKLKEQEEKHKQELKELEEKLDKKHAEQIKDLFLSGSPSNNEDGKQKEDENEKTFYEKVEEKLKQKLKL